MFKWISNSIFRVRICRHVFKGPDMGKRNSEGLMEWPCCKCNKVYIEQCGLDFVKHGRIEGPWGAGSHNGKT